MKKFIQICQSHLILVKNEDRKIGISATLIGWALIAIATVFFHKSTTTLSYEINFFLQFFTASIILIISSLFLGFSFLKTQNYEKNNLSKNILLTKKQRLGFLLVRAVIAIIGYMAYSASANYTTIVDNSSIFSADAIIYLFIIWIVLKEKVSFLQVVSIIIATIGISLIFFIDINALGINNATKGIFYGLLSSTALAIVILMTSIMVQHEPPIKIAIYQCVIGLIIASIALIYVFLTQKIDLNFTKEEIIYSCFAGGLYAIALLFFFNAFLYTEPIIIAVLGYFLTPFMEFFDWTINKEILSSKTILSSILICLGGSLAILNGYLRDSKKHGLLYHPIHKSSLVDTMNNLKEQFDLGKINFYHYMSRIHEFNKLLFGFSSRLKGTDLKNIEIKSDDVYFNLKTNDIKMITDGSCRSAPLEILNFGKYEPEESELILEMIQDNFIIFDIGAHIGWYSLNFSKKFPRAKIFAFEPIQFTYNILCKNIYLNSVSNIEHFNYGLSNKNESIDFYYFKGGSALASPKNLINHPSTEKIKCNLKILDHIFATYNIKNLDFMKIDVEGSELKVIKGSINTIQSHLPIIYIELYEPWCKQFGYTADDVLSMLMEKNYICFSVENRKLKKEISITNENEKYNYFFLHKEKHKKIIKKYT